MSPRHFANLYKQTSHRHDSPTDGEIFNKDFGALCGMLYSIVTLKAFFPLSPAKKITDSPVKDSIGDPKYTQLPLW